MKIPLIIAIGFAIALGAAASSEQKGRMAAEKELADAKLELKEADKEYAATAKASTDAGAEAAATKQLLADAGKEKQQLEAKLAKNVKELEEKMAALEKLREAAIAEVKAKPIDPPKPAKPRPYKNAALSDAILRARDEGKEVVIVFRQTVCPPCDAFEASVLNTRYFKDESKAGYEVVTVNIDDDPALGKLYKVSRTPLVVVYSPNSSNAEATIRKRFIPQPETYMFLNQLGWRSDQ